MDRPVHVPMHVILSPNKMQHAAYELNGGESHSGLLKTTRGS